MNKFHNILDFSKLNSNNSNKLSSKLNISALSKISKCLCNLKFKLLFIFLIFLIFTTFLLSNFSYANNFSLENLDISAGAVFLMDNRTNKILLEKNSNSKMFPASTTKILTAIVVLENCNLSDVVTASYNAVMSVPSGYTVANIQVGEQLTVEQLLELTLVISANDAANVLAEHIGGSVESFVAMMNTKMNELGLTNSHFTNPYGLQDENHYVTAKDLAFLMQYCMKNNTFRKIAGQASCAIPATNLSAPRSYNSTNQLLIAGSPSYYPYATAGKTGFTSGAKECLVSTAFKDDLELVLVVLGSNNRFSDSRKIFKFAYENYSVKKLASQGDTISTTTIPNGTKDTKDLDIILSEDIFALTNVNTDISKLEPTINLNKNLSAPIDEGEIIGKATYELEGVSYTTDIIASHLVKSIDFSSIVFYGFGFVFFLILLYGIFFHKKKSTN